MSSIVLAAATEALSSVTGLSDFDSQGTGNLNGRKATHWSFKLFIAGCIVGSIAAIAGFIIGGLGVSFIGYIVGAGGLLLALTNGFAAFYVERFAVLKTLEEYTQILAERLKQLAGKTLELKKINQDLEKINLGFKEIPKSWKHEIENGRKMLEEKTKDLEKVTVKLEAAQKKLDQLAQITVQLGHQTGEITKAAVEFGVENGLLGEKVENLQGQVSNLDKENDELISHIKNLDSQNDQTEEALSAFSKNNNALEELYAMMKEMYLQAKHKMEGLQKEVNSLKSIVPAAVESSEKVEQTTVKYTQMINALELKLEKYKGYKQGYTLWQTWVKSEEYQTYMEWRKKGGAL
jgi:chromosome segregation ATPase